MAKPEKYLVFTKHEIVAMYNMLKEQEIERGIGSVVLRCQMAGKKVPGQLQLTDECRISLYPYWPTSECVKCESPDTGGSDLCDNCFDETIEESA